MALKNKGAVSAVAVVVGVAIVLGAIYLLSRPGVPDYVDNESPAQNVNAPATASQPLVSTGNVGSITQNTAVFTGEVNPNGDSTSYWYEYGSSNSLGSTTPRQTVGGGIASSPAPATAAGLLPNTTYYYRLVAENQYGISRGAILSFTTSN